MCNNSDLIMCENNGFKTGRIWLYVALSIILWTDQQLGNIPGQLNKDIYPVWEELGGIFINTVILERKGELGQEKS